MQSPTLQKLADHIQFSCRDGEFLGKICFGYIGTLMHSEKNADLILRSRDAGELKAHRFVLAMRSKFFSSMFASRMKEEREETLEIPELNLKELQIFREFLYTGHLWRLDIEKEEAPCAHWSKEDEYYHSLFALFDAAEKYDIPDLKEILAFELECKCTTENAIEFQSYLDRYTGIDAHKKWFQTFVDECFAGV